MNIPKNLRRMLLTLAVVAISGCASAYHEYPHGCAPYGYYYPPPLPYTHYDACPRPLAQSHTIGDQRPDQVERTQDEKPAVETVTDD